MYAGPGIHALDIATGAVLWSHSEENTCSQDSFECFAGFSAPISLSSGILFAGGLNGIFHAYSSSTGAKLWKFDTRREYRSVNQLTGKGGTIDGSGPVIAGDMLYLNSGYGRYGKLAIPTITRVQIKHISGNYWTTSIDCSSFTG